MTSSMREPRGGTVPHAHTRGPAAQRDADSGARTGAAAFADWQGSPRMVAQRKAIEALFGAAVQRQEAPEEEEPVQRRRAGQDAPAAGSSSGLPAQLREGIEALSGMDMSDVRVHRDSGRPAQVGALAYAQGNDIHLGAGQEQTLPHEAWHVVQQRQGRVQPTMQMAGLGVNDDESLESEADLMGDKAAAGAAQAKSDPVLAAIDESPRQLMQRHRIAATFGSAAPVQRALPPGKPNTNDLYTAQGKGEAYNKGRPATFSTGFKRGLLRAWQDSGDYQIMHSSGGNKEYVRTVTGKSDRFADWVPIGAFQIDHVYPWDSIRTDLWDRAEAIEGMLGAAFPAVSKYKKAKTSNTVSSLRSDIPLTSWEDDCYLIDSKNEKSYRFFSEVTKATEKQQFADEVRSGDTMVMPTMHAARMYFHDFKNLQPMQGSENAGKGATVGGHKQPVISDDQGNVESYVTRKYLSIIDSVQNAYVSLAKNPKNKTLIKGLDSAWGAKGKAWKPLEEAEAAAKSSSTGAPSTPQRLSKMTVTQVDTPDHI